MRLTNFEAISLSCYGTLVDKEAGVFAALQPLLSRGVAPLSRNDALAAFAVHEAAEADENPGMSYSKLLSLVHRRLARDWYVSVSDDAHELFGMSVTHWPVYADAPGAVQYLKRYFKVVVLSNGDRLSLASSSRRLGVAFDGVFSAEDIGSYKPSQKNYEYMLGRLEKLGLDRRHVLHVGHSLFHDHDPAASVGISTAWIDRRHGQEGWGLTMPSSCASRYDFRFLSMADMVRSHQELLTAF